MNRSGRALEETTSVGTWGAGLYDSDYASDLRASLKAVTRLPLDGPALLRVLAEHEGEPDPDDQNVYWLVVADQFCKMGVACPEAQANALEIIEHGRDLELCTRLGMSATLLKKRAKILDALAARLREWPAKKRKTMARPDPLLLQVGEVVVYPTSAGEPVNPYRGERQKNPEWVQDGWGAAVVVEADLLFGYLAWYRPIVSQHSWSEKPALEMVLDSPAWNLEHAATCSSKHYQRMELETLGHAKLSQEWREHLGPRFVNGRQAALSDISLSNRLKAQPGDQFGLMSRSQFLL